MSADLCPTTGEMHRTDWTDCPHCESQCHCGKPVHTHEDGFTRGLCERCDAVRCDAEPGACRTRRGLPRPQIIVIETLDYWNGTTQFLGRYVRHVFDTGNVYGLVYGCVTEECDRNLDSDDPRVYDLWDLPPRGGVLWQIKEDELVYEKSDEGDSS